MLTYALFYRRTGIRRIDQLGSPVLTPMSDMLLPDYSMVHFLGDEGEVGPSRQYFLLQGVDRSSWLDHVYVLIKEDGRPRPHRINYVGEITNFHRKHPKIKRLMRVPQSITDKRTLLIRSYNGLLRLYKYIKTPMSNYQRWSNLWSTIWHNINDVSVPTKRNQFIAMDLPDVVPAISAFRKAESNPGPQTLRAFKTDTTLNLLDLWRWLGPNRSSSSLSILSHEALNYINIVFTYKGKFAVLNLGLLNSWRKTPEGEALSDDEINERGTEAEWMQKRFLLFLLNATGVKEEAVETEPTEGEELLEDATDPTESVDEEGQVILADDTEAAENIARAMLLDEDGEDDIKLDTDDADDALPEVPTDELDIDEELTVHDALVGHLEEEDVNDEVVETEVGLDLSSPETYVFKTDSLENPVAEKAQRLVEQGAMSVPEYRRITELAHSYKTMPNPMGTGTVKDAITIESSELLVEPSQFPDIPTVLDKTMLSSTLNNFDPVYIKQYMHRDILGAVMGIQRHGIAVSNIETREHVDALNHYTEYKLKLTPPAGKPTTVSFKIPVVTEEGTVMSGGVNYYLKKQRGDVPIRKIGPTRVALTSYYGKLFIDRSENSTVNYGRWITDRVRALGLDDENPTVTAMRSANSFDAKLAAPRAYTALAMAFKSFTVKPVVGSFTDRYDFFFNYNEAVTYFGQPSMDRMTNGDIIVGRDQNKTPIGMDKDGVLHLYKLSNKQALGTLETLLGLPSEKKPVEIVNVNVFGKGIPMVMVLGYHMGLSKLIKLLGVTPRFVPRGSRMQLTDNEYAIRFKDVSMILPRDAHRAALILAGFKTYHRTIANYPIAMFDKADAYVNILDSANLGVRYIREINLIYDMYLDDITRSLLTDMGEPTDMVGLYLRAAELLTNDQHPDEIDGLLTRYRGYERFAGAVYQELVKACRLKAARPVSQRVGLELHPEAVYLQILGDSAMEVTNDINPIQNLKQKEVVTFGGSGGRKADTLVKRTRVYHENDIGVISEATVDSGSVGVISFLSANPNLVDLRGRVRKGDVEADGLTSTLSTSALLSPCATREDAKRTGFISIQHSHGISCKGYRATPLRTGYEQVLAHRTDDLFAYTAKADGKIIARDKKSIMIEYSDGSYKAIELGRRFGKSAGSVVPHSIECDLKVGDIVKAGDVVCYNSEFFERSWISPNQVSWKAGVLVKTMIMDTATTYEDSSIISERIAKELVSKTTHIRQIVLDFEQTPHELVKVGDSVDFESILCTIEDPTSAGGSLFDEETLGTLKLLSTSAPKAKYTGVVEKVEVFYNGEVDDMSEGLQSLAIANDRSMGKLYTALGKPRINGKIDGTYRIDNNPLLKNQLVINIYITSDVSMGNGDKLVFGNQLKSTVGAVMSGVNRIKDGDDIDAIFAYESISNRIVLSPEIIGTTNTLLLELGKRFVDIYRKG